MRGHMECMGKVAVVAIAAGLLIPAVQRCNKKLAEMEQPSYFLPRISERVNALSEGDYCWAVSNTYNGFMAAASNAVHNPDHARVWQINKHFFLGYEHLFFRKEVPFAVSNMYTPFLAKGDEAIRNLRQYASDKGIGDLLRKDALYVANSIEGKVGLAREAEKSGSFDFQALENLMTTNLAKLRENPERYRRAQRAVEGVNL